MTARRAVLVAGRARGWPPVVWRAARRTDKRGEKRRARLSAACGTWAPAPLAGSRDWTTIPETKTTSPASTTTH